VLSLQELGRAGEWKKHTKVDQSVQVAWAQLLEGTIKLS